MLNGYITPELKEKEALILEAEEKIIEFEYNIFIRSREQVKSYIARLQNLQNKSVSWMCFNALRLSVKNAIMSNRYFQRIEN